MEKVTYLILEKISQAENHVSWYQISRMISSRGLHKYLDNLNEILTSLEKAGLIIIQSNHNLPQLLSITDLGLIELSRLKKEFAKDV